MLFRACQILNQFFPPLINSTQIRTKVRYYLPYPTEVKRVRKQGFRTKVQTKAGRRILMTRLLRGEKVIAQ